MRQARKAMLVCSQGGGPKIYSAMSRPTLRMRRRRIRCTVWFAYHKLWFVTDPELILRCVAQSHEMLVTRFKRAYRLCYSTETEPRVVRGLAHYKHGTACNGRLQQRVSNDAAPESAALMLGTDGYRSQMEPNCPPFSIG